MELDDLRGLRYRLARAHAHQAEALAKRLKRDPDAAVGTDGMMPCIHAWNAFDKADAEYRALKEREAEVDEV